MFKVICGGLFWNGAWDHKKLREVERGEQSRRQAREVQRPDHAARRRVDAGDERVHRRQSTDLGQ